MVAYFKGKNHKLKKKCKKYKLLSTIIKSFDTIVITATASSSIKLSLTGSGLIAIRLSTAAAGGLSIGTKVIYQIIINKHKKNQYEKDQQTIKPFNLLINSIKKFAGLFM